MDSYHRSIAASSGIDQANDNSTIATTNHVNSTVTASTSTSTTDWTITLVLSTLALFAVTGLAEIGGGWLVWKFVRDNKPFYWAIAGSATLVLYGFLPTLQPNLDDFGRVYAIYGGFFIILSFLWGWALDGNAPDRGDMIGSSIALAGVLLVLFWPR